MKLRTERKTTSELKRKNETVKTGQGYTHKEDKRETPLNCKVWMSDLEHPQVVMGLLIIIPLGNTPKM